MTGGGITYDITPATMSTGREDAGLNLGLAADFTALVIMEHNVHYQNLF